MPVMTACRHAWHAMLKTKLTQQLHLFSEFTGRLALFKEMPAACFGIGGESGIRTHGTLLGHTRSPGVLLKPLGHLSRQWLRMSVFHRTCIACNHGDVIFAGKANRSAALAKAREESPGNTGYRTS